MINIIRNQIIDKYLWGTHTLLDLWICPEIVVYKLEAKHERGAKIYFKALKIDRSGGDIKVTKLISNNHVWDTYDEAYIHAVAILHKSAGMFEAVHKLIL